MATPHDEAVTATTVGRHVTPSLSDLRHIITKNRNDAFPAGNFAGQGGREILVRGDEGFKILQLGVPALSQRLLVGRAKLWSHNSNEYVEQTVLVDSMSEITLAAEPFFAHGVCKGSLSLHGPAAPSAGNKLIARVEGVVRMKINLDDAVGGDGTGVNGGVCAVDIQCVRALDLPRGAALLLNAHAAAKLGIISAPLSVRGCGEADLPEMNCLVDLQRLRELKCIGPRETTYDAIDCVPDALSDHPSNSPALTMLDEEGGDDDDHGSAEVAELYVAEADVERVLHECGREPFPDRVYSIDDITIGVDATPAAAAACGIPGVRSGGKISIEQAGRLRQLLERKRAAFSTSKFPPANKAPPLRVTLKEGVKPFYMPAPKETAAKKEYLWKQRLYLEKCGGLEDASHSEWAYRIHIAGKGGLGEDDGLLHDLRSTDDSKGLNQRSVHMKQEMPDGPRQLDIASQASVCTFHSDAASAYNAFVIDERDRDYFTCWWPSGPRQNDPWVKLRRTRMPFGFCNAAQWMVGYFNQMKSSLPQWVRDVLACFVDDFALPGTTTFDRFLEALEIFLDACIEFGTYLAPWKTFIGLLVNKFWGFNIDAKGGAVLSERNIKAIKEMKPPNNAAEVSSLVGAWTQNRRWVSMFSDIMAPLTDLTKKGTPWKWGPEQQHAFDTAQQALIDATAVYKPNYEERIVVQTDASDYGLGSRTFQRIDDEEYNIGFYSRKLSPVERGMPVYFRELVALVEGVKAAEIYALSSNLPLLVETDHKALEFTRYVDRGPLSGWALAQIGHINIEVTYLPGPKNAIADWLSRYQLLGRNEFSTSGFAKALAGLLRQLGPSCQLLRVVWVYASPAESDVQAQRQVQQWRTPTNALLKGAPVEHHLARHFDLAILAPLTLKAPLLAHQLLKADRSFAMLIPADLLDYVPMSSDGAVDADVHRRMQSVNIVTLGGSGLVWIVHGTEARSGLCLSMEAHPGTDGAHSDWTDSSSYECGATWSMLDVHPEDSTSDSDDDDDDVAAQGLPTPAEAALRHATALTSKTLRRVLDNAGSSSSGHRVQLVQRVAEWLTPQYESQELQRQAELMTRREQSELHRDVPFYDVEGYHNGEPGESRFIVEQLLTDLGPVARWAGEQLDTDAEGHGARRVPDGVLVYRKDGGDDRVVVPLSKRELVMRLLHEELGHGTTSTAAEIAKVFFWPNLRRDVDLFLAACATCLRNKQRVVRSHKLWRARAYYKPRTHYSMDIKRIAAPDSLAYVLIVVDRFSGWATCVRMNDKQTDSVIAALTTRILYQFGPMEELTIDSAKEFESRQMDEWAERNNVVVIKPLAYNSQANAASERFWRHFNARMMATNDYPGDTESDARITWEWNIQQRRGTGYSPYQLMYGAPVVTRALNHARGVHTLRPPTAEERAELEQCLQDTAETITSIAANRANGARRASAIERNRNGVAVLPDLMPGEKCMFYQPASGGLAKGRGRSRAFVPAFSGPATVLARISNVGYWLKGDTDGRYYYRHRAALRRLPPRVPVGAVSSAEQRQGEASEVAVEAAASP